jgi:hypothetical protein
VISVCGKVHDVGVVKETLLSSVTVVDIPVDNENFLDTKLLLSIRSSNSYVIDNTVTTSQTRLRMMARGANNRETAIKVPRNYVGYELAKRRSSSLGFPHGVRCKVNGLELFCFHVETIAALARRDFVETVAATEWNMSVIQRSNKSR